MMRLEECGKPSNLHGIRLPLSNLIPSLLKFDSKASNGRIKQLLSLDRMSLYLPISSHLNNTMKQAWFEVRYRAPSIFGQPDGRLDGCPSSDALISAGQHFLWYNMKFSHRVRSAFYQENNDSPEYNHSQFSKFMKPMQRGREKRATPEVSTILRPKP